MEVGLGTPRRKVPIGLAKSADWLQTDCGLLTSASRSMSQGSDGSVAAAMSGMHVARSDSQLARDADELLAEAPEANASTNVGGLAASMEAATGKCDSSNGSSDHDDNDEEFEQEYEDEEDMDCLLSRGGVMLQRFASKTQSQETDDGGDYEEELIRKEFATIKTSTWMQKKIDAKHVELSALVAQHEKSKKDLVAPVKEMMKEHPTRKQSLTAFAGLLSDACTDGELRAKIIESAAVLKSQEKIVDNVQKAMQVIQVGQVCLEEKKAEEAKKRGESSSVMGAAASLVSNAKRSTPASGSASKRRK